jgi:predicted dehydrogenase
MKDGIINFGILGCGAIAQFAHLPALARAKRARLVALCDAAEDLLENIARRTSAQRLYTRYDDMLADPLVHAAIIAVPDPFHVPLAIRALNVGKHVLVEKPMGTNAAECVELLRAQQRSGLKVQVGSMKRHDPGVAHARAFIASKVGAVHSVGAVYRDSMFRTKMQESCLDPLIVSRVSVKPATNPKANRELYNLWTQGAHLFDTIQFLCGRISAVNVKLARQEEQFSWHGLVEFAGPGAAIGHFELTCKASSDWCERYEVCGERGSVEVNVHLPFYHRPARTRCFDGTAERYESALGGHSNAYANQLEAFARSILEDLPTNPDAAEGLSVVRVLEAVTESYRSQNRVEVILDSETSK